MDKAKVLEELLPGIALFLKQLAFALQPTKSPLEKTRQKYVAIIDGWGRFRKNSTSSVTEFELQRAREVSKGQAPSHTATTPRGYNSTSSKPEDRHSNTTDDDDKEEDYLCMNGTREADTSLSARRKRDRKLSQGSTLSTQECSIAEDSATEHDSSLVLEDLGEEEIYVPTYFNMNQNRKAATLPPKFSLPKERSKQKRPMSLSTETARDERLAAANSTATAANGAANGAANVEVEKAAAAETGTNVMLADYVNICYDGKKLQQRRWCVIRRDLRALQCYIDDSLGVLDRSIPLTGLKVSESKKKSKALDVVLSGRGANGKVVVCLKTAGIESKKKWMEAFKEEYFYDDCDVEPVTKRKGSVTSIKQEDSNLRPCHLDIASNHTSGTGADHSPTLQHNSGRRPSDSHKLDLSDVTIGSSCSDDVTGEVPSSPVSGDPVSPGAGGPGAGSQKQKPKRITALFGKLHGTLGRNKKFEIKEECGEKYIRVTKATSERPKLFDANMSFRKLPPTPLSSQPAPSKEDSPSSPESRELPPPPLPDQPAPPLDASPSSPAAQREDVGGVYNYDSVEFRDGYSRVKSEVYDSVHGDDYPVSHVKFSDGKQQTGDNDEDEENYDYPEVFCRVGTAERKSVAKPDDQKAIDSDNDYDVVERMVRTGESAEDTSGLEAAQQQVPNTGSLDDLSATQHFASSRSSERRGSEPLRLPTRASSALNLDQPLTHARTSDLGQQMLASWKQILRDRQEEIDADAAHKNRESGIVEKPRSLLVPVSGNDCSY